VLRGSHRRMRPLAVSTPPFCQLDTRINLAAFAGASG
jgi:hypothetical protein